MSDNAQPGGGTTGTSGNGAVNAITPEVQKIIDETVNRALSNRERRHKQEMADLKAEVAKFSGEGLAAQVEAAIVKMAASDDPDDPSQVTTPAAQPAKGNGATSAAAPAANDELKALRDQLAAMQRQIAQERQQAEVKVQEAANQARLSRVAAHVKATLGERIKGNPALVDLLAKELVREQKAVDEVDGAFVWRTKQPDGAGGYIEDHKPFDDGFKEWASSAGKNFIPAPTNRLPTAGGIPYDGSTQRTSGDGSGGVAPKIAPRMQAVLGQMQRDLQNAVGTPQGTGDGNQSQ